jgi:hypothetical protein
MDPRLGRETAGCGVSQKGTKVAIKIIINFFQKIF